MKKSNLSFLMGYLKKHIALLIISIICSLLASLLTLYIPYVVGQSIDVLKLGQDQVDNGKIHRLPLKYLDNQPVGQIVNRVISDVEIISDGLIMGFNQLFSSVITIIACLVIMFVMNYKIAAVVVIFTPLSIFVARFISKSTFNLFKKQSTIKASQIMMN